MKKIIMQFKKESWGTYKDKPTQLFTISDTETGFLVQISDFGATLVRVMVPDRNGHVDDVNYGQNTPEAYIEEGGYLGAVIGRVANRIGGAKFELDGKEYELFVNNNGVHSLHGGKEGFNVKIWDLEESKIDDDEVELVFKYVSPDGEENYPGTLTTNLTYTIKPMYIAWEFRSTTDKKTILNLTNHAYWNLDGLESTIDDLILTVNGDQYMPGDETNIPTGEVVNVEETGYDLRQGSKLQNVFEDVGDLDNNYLLKDYDASSPKLRFAAEVLSPKNGRKMTVETTEPCIQVYSGNFMGDLKSFGQQCKKHGAICLETQRVPNAIHFPEFRDSVILSPNEEYMHKTVHKFSASKFIDNAED